MRRIFSLIVIAAMVMAISCQENVNNSDDSDDREFMNELYRPQYHFTPQEKWMNDPNGMVYYDGTYHLFFQHYPDALHWGPMHWGHTTSDDLFSWKHQDIALYPDSLGYIFSGSAVVDKNNTSGFQEGEEKPLVAIFTHHNPDNGQQVQSLAYSTDEGQSWTKYKGNPVIDNPGIQDFRDPKVFWHEGTSKWIMVLAAGDHVRFYSSPDLKEWSLESTFGKNTGAHGGVWECPDLFPLALDGDSQNKKWVLLVSINPGAPNGGSGTQYFVGDFDGYTFTNEIEGNQWLDYGTDNYAGVTWSNTPERKIFIGWMNNWTYADKIPTSSWRGAMTLPRKLSLESVYGSPRVISEPIKEIQSFKKQMITMTDKDLSNNPLTQEFVDVDLRESLLSFDIATQDARGIILRFSNQEGQEMEIGFRSREKDFYIDRRDAGVDTFHQAFPAIHEGPFEQWPQSLTLDIYLDRSSIELFVNGGERVMTDRIFNSKAFSKLEIYTTAGEAKLERLDVYEIKPVWTEELMN
jgi:fructan beta-fructosidase